MNFDRSTDGFTPLHWLNLIQRGGTEDWRDLYAHCRDRQFAAQVASLLPMSDPDLLPSARLWKWLLEDLHPGLVVRLPAAETVAVP
jgi:hypothetical protein